VYEAHFGLGERPFRETVDPAAFLPLSSRQAALRRLRYGLEHGSGPALVFGPSGAGKSLLVRTLARDMGGPFLHLTFPAMSAAELLTFLADELSAPPASAPGLAGAVRRLRGSLAAAALKGERILLIVDEAQLIDDEATFESLRLLLNFTSAGAPDLALLMAGDPEIVLRIPPALTDRLAAHCMLGPLTESESAEYVLGRLSAAGATQSLFNNSALAALHRAASGLPRRLNRLADLCLLIAYAQERGSADEETVTIAVREAAIDGLAA
jgi:type II secretory pathway predicted ATPase ExeA